jgi:hypothetical protein
MFAASVDSVDAPLGALDRIRLDKITVVPDGALPLAGGLSGNNPDNRDRTTDLVWGFPASSGTNGFYANHLDAKDENPFWYEGSLIHELGHARYLIDTYGFNVGDRASDPKILVRHNGVPIGGTPWLPRSFPWWDHVSISVGGTGNPFFGLMGGYYSMVDRYSVMALNRIAHQRAILGNYNAPGNIGVFINDLPASNQVQLLDGWGNTIGNAGVTIYRATGSPEWYGKRFQDSPALTFTADSVGRVNVGRNPFANGPLQHTFGISTMEALVKVESGGRVGFAFLAAGLFNMEFWRGHTNQGRYSLIVPMLGAQREFAIVRSWPDGTGWRVQVVVGGETQPNSVLVGNISAFYQEGSWWAWSPTDMAGQLVTATWADSFSVEQRMPVTRHPLKASWATVMSSGDRKNVQISTPSLNGYVYELQTSPDLEEWTLAPEGRLFGTGQPVEWPQPTVAPHNFYRFVIRQLGR